MVLGSEQVRLACKALLGLAVVALLPAALHAAGIGFRNDCSYPIYVQGSIIVNGQIKRGPLLLIKPKETTWDVNLPKGNRTITIYSTANQKLFQEMRVFQGTDQIYSVMAAAVPPRQPPRVELRELPVPKSK